MERIQGAAGSLDERLAELSAQEANLGELHRRLAELTALLASNEAPNAPQVRTELVA